MEFPSPVPEIPAANVDKAVDYYVAKLGFTLDWGDDAGGIAGVSRGDCRLFITSPGFRASSAIPVQCSSGLTLKAPTEFMS